MIMILTRIIMIVVMIVTLIIKMIIKIMMMITNYSSYNNNDINDDTFFIGR